VKTGMLVNEREEMLVYVEVVAPTDVRRVLGFAVEEAEIAEEVDADDCDEAAADDAREVEV
jgi:hypothetical protein